MGVRRQLAGNEYIYIAEAPQVFSNRGSKNWEVQKRIGRYGGV